MGSICPRDGGHHHGWHLTLDMVTPWVTPAPAMGACPHPTPRPHPRRGVPGATSRCPNRPPRFSWRALNDGGDKRGGDDITVGMGQWGGATRPGWSSSRRPWGGGDMEAWEGPRGHQGHPEGTWGTLGCHHAPLWGREVGGAWGQGGELRSPASALVLGSPWLRPLLGILLAPPLLGSP